MSCFRHRGAIQCDVRTLAPPAVVVQRASHQFLAGPAFTGDEHGCFRRRDLADQIENADHRFGSSHHVAERAFGRELPPELLVLLSQPALRTGAGQQNLKGCGIDGLFQKPETAQIVNGGDGFFNAAERGHHDGRRHPILGPEGTQQLKPIHPRHHQVSHQNVDRPSRKKLQGFFAICGLTDCMPPFTNDRGQILPLFCFVINHENCHATRLWHERRVKIARFIRLSIRKCGPLVR